MSISSSAFVSNHRPYYAVPIEGNFNSPDLGQLPFLEPDAVGDSFDAYIAPLAKTHDVVISPNARREFLNQSPLQQQLSTRLIMDYRDLKSAGYFAHPSQRLELSHDKETCTFARMNNYIMLSQSDQSVPSVFSALEIKNDDLFHNEKSKRLASLIIPHEEFHNAMLHKMPFNTTFKAVEGLSAWEEGMTDSTFKEEFSFLGQVTKAGINTYIDKTARSFQTKRILAEVRKQHPQQDVPKATRELLTNYMDEHPSEFFTTLMEARANLTLSEEGHDPALQNALGLKTPQAYSKLVKQSSQPFTAEEKELTLALTESARKRVPAFAEMLQRQEAHWPTLKKIMLQWGSKPQAVLIEEGFEALKNSVPRTKI
jgi:hypothetical protein